jgi:hypothetical protein
LERYIYYYNQSTKNVEVKSIDFPKPIGLFLRNGKEDRIDLLS